MKGKLHQKGLLKSALSAASKQAEQQEEKHEKPEMEDSEKQQEKHEKPEKQEAEKQEAQKQSDKQVEVFCGGEDFADWCLESLVFIFEDVRLVTKKHNLRYT